MKSLAAVAFVLALAQSASANEDLFTASEHGDAETIGTLIAAGANPNEDSQHGDTPLHVAAYHGHSEVIDALIAGGADPNVRDNRGLTPLHFAAVAGQPEAIYALHASGAVPTVRAFGRGGLTPCTLQPGKATLKPLPP